MKAIALFLCLFAMSTFAAPDRQGAKEGESAVLCEKVKDKNAVKALQSLNNRLRKDMVSVSDYNYLGNFSVTFQKPYSVSAPEITDLLVCVTLTQLEK